MLYTRLASAMILLGRERVHRLLSVDEATACVTFLKSDSRWGQY